MILYPAVDISEGRAVRLTRGDFDARTVYHDDPLDAARSWVAAGARFLHVVDLDGARTGKPVSLDHLRRIASGAGVPVQYGGGLRTPEAVRAALDAVAARVVLGTAAYVDVDFLDDVLAAHRARVVVSVDARGGLVTTAGWTQATGIPVVAVIDRLRLRGVGSFIYTDVDRDGMLDGPDLDRVRGVGAAVHGRFLYSGGVGSLEDLRALVALRQVNLAGVIVGKALYERRFTVGEAQAVLGEGGQLRHVPGDAPCP